MLSLGEIKVGKHIFEEAGDGVGVLVLFSLDDTGELLDVVSRADIGGFGSSAGDDGGRNEVSEEVRARGLDGVEIGGERNISSKPWQPWFSPRLKNTKSDQ